MKFICTFNYNNKDYVFYLEKEQIKFGYLKENVLKDNLTNAEINLLLNVYNQIRPMECNCVCCGKYKIRGEIIEIYYDTKTGIYSFLEEKNCKKYVPKENMLVLLNKYYNYQSGIVYNEKTKRNKLNLLKRIVSIGTSLIMVYVSAGIPLNMLPEPIEYKENYSIQAFDDRGLIPTDGTYTFEDIVTAIDANMNITEEEKDFLKEILKAEFEENKQYMNIPKVLERLSTYTSSFNKQYTYNKETGEYELLNPEVPIDVLGRYNYTRNTIDVYERLNDIPEDYEEYDYEFSEENACTYFHEINHLQSETSNNITDNTDTILEIENELLTREYAEEYIDNHSNTSKSLGYDTKMQYIYALAEILDDETLRKYKYKSDLNTIIAGLMDIDNNSEKAEELITSINLIDLYKQNLSEAEKNLRAKNLSDSTNSNEKEQQEFENAQQEEQENYKRIHDGLAYFYEKKYGRNMSNDMGMLACLYNTPAITDEEIQNLYDFILKYNNTNTSDDEQTKFCVEEQPANSMIFNGFSNKTLNERTTNIATPYIDLLIPKGYAFQYFENKHPNIAPPYIYSITPKGYVSQYFEKKHPNIVIKCFVNNKKVEIEITDSNRYVEQEELKENKTSEER